jgi:hypothetical protein
MYMKGTDFLCRAHVVKLIKIFILGNICFIHIFNIITPDIKLTKIIFMERWIWSRVCGRIWWDLMFLQRYCWRFNLSGKLCRFVWSVATDVLKYRNASIFRTKKTRRVPAPKKMDILSPYGEAILLGLFHPQDVGTTIFRKVGDSLPIETA